MLSIILGSLIGILYGLFFVTQQRRALSLDRTSFAHHLAKSVLFSLARLIILAIAMVYILHSSSINLILLLLSFLTSFFIISYFVKLQHVRRKSSEEKGHSKAE
jgi:Ca2+/Na+ antiporter